MILDVESVGNHSRTGEVELGVATYVITGATSGIGLAMAEQLHDAHRLVLIGRKPLDEIEHSLFHGGNYCRADLACADAASTIDAWCDHQGVDQIDVLINNAGVGFAGALWEQSAASIRELVAVNLTAPIAITQRLLPRVRAASGTVLFVSSVVSTVAGADMAVYAATKKALDGFVRSLRAERSIGDVSLRVVHPGATRTAMPDKVGIPSSTSSRWRSAESVAEEILGGIDSRSVNRAIGLPNKAVRAVSRRAPRLAARAASARRSDLAELSTSGERKRVLVTGAADGIGRALALRYAAAGAHVVGVDVDTERAADTAALGPTDAIEFEITDLRESDMSWLAGRSPFDVVVHNAGTSAVGPFESIDPEHHRAVIELNFVAPMLLTRELLAHGKINDGGRVVLMSSLSHQMSYPGATVYAASKDGLELYGRALRSALRPHVAITTVFPGPTRTAHAVRYSPQNDDATVARRMDPDELARRIIDHEGSRLLPGSLAKASAALGTLSPAVGGAVMRRTVYAGLAEPD